MRRLRGASGAGSEAAIYFFVKLLAKMDMEEDKPKGRYIYDIGAEEIIMLMKW